MSARILVVDDEDIVIKSCMRILEGGDYQIESARDGREALRKVEDNPYDIMILDIMMPNWAVWKCCAGSRRRIPTLTSS